MLKFCSFSSGSSGNCYLIKSEKTALLVDAGISLKRIRQGLALTETPEEAVSAVLITHEHADHVKSVAALSGKRGLKRPEGNQESLTYYANGDTWYAMDRLPGTAGFDVKRETIGFKEDFQIGDIRIHPFHLSHDAAACTGYTFQHGKSRIAIVTDTGVITDEIREAVRNTDLLVLESNHDVEMLRIGRYPWFLKQRILGDYGHLSNDTAADFIVELLKEGTAPGIVALAHLSAENNFPEMAWQTLSNAVTEAGFSLGKDIRACILVRDTISELFSV